MDKDAKVVADLARYLKDHGCTIAANMMGEFYMKYPKHRDQIKLDGKRNVRSFCESHPETFCFSPPGIITLVRKAKENIGTKAKAKAKVEGIHQNQAGVSTILSKRYPLSRDCIMCCKWSHGECKYGKACSFLHEDCGWNPCEYGASCTRDHKARDRSLTSLWDAVLALLKKHGGRFHVGSGIGHLYKEDNGAELKSLIKSLGGVQELCKVFGSAIALEVHTSESGASQPMIALKDQKGATARSDQKAASSADSKHSDVNTSESGTSQPMITLKDQNCVTARSDRKVASSDDSKHSDVNKTQNPSHEGPLFGVRVDVLHGHAVASFKDEHIRNLILRQNDATILIKSLPVELKPYIDKQQDCEISTKLFVGWNSREGLACDFSACDLIDFFESECQALGVVASGSNSSPHCSRSKPAETPFESKSSYDGRLEAIQESLSANESWSSKVVEALDAMQSRQSKLEEAEKRLKVVVQEEWSRLQVREHMLRNWEEEIKEREANAAKRLQRWEEQLRSRESALVRQESFASVAFVEQIPPVEEQERRVTKNHVWLAPPSEEDGWARYRDETNEKDWWFHEDSGRWFFEGDSAIRSA